MPITPIPLERPYRLPLDRDAFREALWRGHGRVILHAKQYGVDPVLDLVVHATILIVGTEYSSQLEPMYDGWLIDLFDAAGCENDIIGEIAQRLENAPPGLVHQWSDGHLSFVLERLAERGNVEARKLLYAIYDNRCDDESRFCSQWIIRLDGADGLIAVAEMLGRRIERYPELKISQGPMACYDEEICDEESRPLLFKWDPKNSRARRILDAAAKSNPQIARFLEHFDAQEESAPSAVTPVPPDPSEPISLLSAEGFSRLVHGIEPHDVPSWVYQWGEQAPDDERSRLLERVLSDPDAKNAPHMIMALMQAELSFIDDRVIALTEHPNDWLRRIVCAMLGAHDPVQARRIAFDRLERGRSDTSVLNLFSAGFEPGDIQRVLRLWELTPTTDPEELEEVVSQIVDTLKDDPVAEAEDFLLFAYEYCRSRWTRHDAVELLLQLDALPDWIREEARCDAHPQIRELFESPARGDEGD